MEERSDEPPAVAVSLLTDDLIMEILCRVPVKSLHRFKCVSRSWRDLIAHPAYRKKLPQTLAGFFYEISYYGGVRRNYFASISGSAATVDLDPSLAFLQPMAYTDIKLVDTRNGLLLCACYNKENSSTEHKLRFVVCNPATQRSVMLPPQPQPQQHYVTWLAFDPAVSSHFHVLNFEQSEQGNYYITGVNIYSSQTGVWTHRDTGLVKEIGLLSTGGSAFLGGMLYLLGQLNTQSINIDLSSTMVLVSVDMEGKAWNWINVPEGCFHYVGTIGLSQGCLHYATTITPVSNNDNENTILPLEEEIALWCLENHDSKEWVLKDSLSIHKQFIDNPLSIDDPESDYHTVGIHPDCDTLFLVPKRGASLASYDMRHQIFCNILDLEKGCLSRHLPYVPLFSESLADADGQ